MTRPQWSAATKELHELFEDALRVYQARPTERALLRMRNIKFWLEVFMKMGPSASEPS